MEKPVDPSCVHLLFLNSPEYVNQDPYEKGWMAKMTVDNPSDIDGLMDAAAYKELVGA